MSQAIINWFPGHMLTALDKAKKAMKTIDLVIEVLDARCPVASSNPLLPPLRQAHSRPVLKLLNKNDLADPAATKDWLGHFQSEKDTTALAISCKNKADVARVLRAAKSICPLRDSMVKPLRIMVMGVPNVGKSTLINALIGKRNAAVGDMPAVTKNLARYYIDDTIVLTDTPGMTWPKIDTPEGGMMMAASHLLGSNSYIDTEVAGFLGDVLLRDYAPLLIAKYKFDSLATDGHALVEQLAKKRGYILKGGVLDLEKASAMLLNDYRSAALGRVSLERVGLAATSDLH